MENQIQSRLSGWHTLLEAKIRKTNSSRWDFSISHISDRSSNLKIEMQLWKLVTLGSYGLSNAQKMDLESPS